MDSTLKAAWIGAVAGFVVWFFSWLWTLWTDRRARNRIRTMVNIEIEDNLEALTGFLAEVDNRVNFTNSPMANMQRGDALSSVPLPTFSHKIWESLTASIPTGLNESEIRDVHGFHAQLDESIRLKNISRGPQSQWRTDVEGVVNGLLERGNPLSERRALTGIAQSNKALSGG